jgi:hypothetical protein
LSGNPTLKEIEESWEADLANFLAIRKNCLFY